MFIFFKNKKIKFVIGFMLLFCFLNFQSIFASQYIDEESNLKIEGTQIDDRVNLNAKNMYRMNLMAKTERIVYIDNTKINIKAIKVSYLLNEFLGIKVREADILFIDSKNKKSIIKSYTDLIDENKDYMLIYSYENTDDNTNLDLINKYKSSGFILIDDKGIVSEKENLFFVDKIIINANFDVEQLPEPLVEFVDIGEKYSYAKEAIYEFANMGAVSGVTEKEFYPDVPATRAFVSKMLVEVLNLDLIEYNGTYSDVQKTDWFAKYVATVTSNELLNGYTDGTFAPNSEINRQEFFALCSSLAIKLKKITEKDIEKFLLTNSNFSDKDSIFGWVENSIAYLYSLGIDIPYMKTEFKPLQAITRGEAVYLIYSVIFNQ